jgi:chromosome transmission fidelity protein 18
MLTPNINPVVVGQGAGSTASVRKASEQQLVSRSVQAMCASGVRFERAKVNAAEDGGAGAMAYGTQWVYRMEPSLDELGTFETGGNGFGESGGKVRFAVRQVLDQEWRKEDKRRAEAARLARFTGGDLSSISGADVQEASDAGALKKGVSEAIVVKRDFFGRPVALPKPGSAQDVKAKKEAKTAEEKRVWITYHEGFSNAVRKPVTLAELMKDL